MVELANGSILHCHPRGKKSNLACGDCVAVHRTSKDQGVVASIAPRSTVLYRSDQYREKIIATNVTQVVVVVAAKPSFYEDVLTRCLIGAESQHVKSLIVLNKADLEEETAATSKRLMLYESLGYPVVRLSAKHDISPLRPLLARHMSVLVGQSGMGKSTIVNALIPGALARTAAVSETLDSGKHTTTSAHVYHLDSNAHIIDSPGMQSFGLHHVPQPQLVEAFPEFRQLIGGCRFNDCRHTVEPGCAIIAAADSGAIEIRRWQAYCSLANELAASKPHWA